MRYSIRLKNGRGWAMIRSAERLHQASNLLIKTQKEHPTKSVAIFDGPKLLHSCAPLETRLAL